MVSTSSVTPLTFHNQLGRVASSDLIAILTNPPSRRKMTRTLPDGTFQRFIKCTGKWETYKTK